MKTCREAREDPESFWSRIASALSWDCPWTKILDDTDQPFTKWFVDGELNACYNAVDRHVKEGKGRHVAIIHDSPLSNTVRKVTYQEILDKVSLLAGVLADYGVKKGDRVVIYMPLIPETVIAMLAVVRIGAIHSVVFGGFVANVLSKRIDHAEPKVIISASCGLEPNKIIRYKEILNEALTLCSWKPMRQIVFQRKEVEVCNLDHPLDVDWEEALNNSSPYPCVPVESNHPLYIVYTSGTTGEPKGLVRSTGPHLAVLAWTMKSLYGVSEGEVFWACSDMGWTLGHSYTCYGPLVAGVTAVMYEGKPDRTPNPEQYFRVIQDHKVNSMITTPTALRMIKRADQNNEITKKYSTKSLRTIFVASEHCDHETRLWAQKAFKVPVLNHWWQSESGHTITASAVGLGTSLDQPKLTIGLPFPGYDVRILRKDGTECSANEIGRLVLGLPLPPGFLTTLYKATKLFLETYFARFPGYYDTMDAGYKDEDGYLYVTSRDDEAIKVAGHLLSTSSMENVVLQHKEVTDAAIISVPDITRGAQPLCISVLRQGCKISEEKVASELILMIRQQIGAIATPMACITVSALPKTRSGKVARKSLTDLAYGRPIKISSAIEDPSVYKEIRNALQKAGYAKNAPDPEWPKGIQH